MASKALDLATIAWALSKLREEGFTSYNWWEQNPEQKFFLDFWGNRSSSLESLQHIKALASPDWKALNVFLQENGFDPMVGSFDPAQGVGVVSVLDMLVQWLQEYRVFELRMHDHNGRTVGTRTAFHVPATGFDVFNASINTIGLPSHPLLRMKTQSGDSLWIHPGPPPESGIDMFQYVLGLSDAPKVPNTGFGDAGIPMVNLDTETDLSWLVGMTSGSWSISTAAQRFKFRMNNKGAHAMVATAITAVRSAAVRRKETFLVDQPFYVWLTQGTDYGLPLAVAYIDLDSMREPAEL